jgi:hypothetical protein
MPKSLADSGLRRMRFARVPGVAAGTLTEKLDVEPIITRARLRYINFPRIPHV